MFDDTAGQVFDFHHSMLVDDLRTRSFLDAIAETVRAGDVVLDLGCGTGILSLFACLAGANKVYAIEQGPVLNLARDIAARSRFGDRVEFLRGWSTQTELPGPVDVIVTETIGSMAFDEGIIGSVTDARRRWLAEGGRILPGSLELHVALVETPDDYADLDRWAQPLYRFDFSPLRSLAVNSPLATNLAERSLLSDGRPVIGIDLGGAERVDLDGRVELTARREGVAHGLGCWFSSQLSPSVVLSNRPPNQVPSWDQVLLPFESPVALAAGDTVAVEIRCSGNGRDWEWRTASGGVKTAQSSARLDLPSTVSPPPEAARG